MCLNMPWLTLTVSVHSGDGSRRICTHALQNFFIFPDRHTWCGCWREWEGKTLLCCLFLEPTAQFESDSLLGHGNIPTHVSRDGKTSPILRLRCQRTPLRKLSDKATQTRFSSSWLFLSGMPFITLAGFYEGRPIFGLSFDIMYTFLLPDAPLWYAVCVPPPCYVTQWAAFFLCSLPLPSTHKHIDHVSHKVHSADGDCWLRGKKPPHDSRSSPSQKTTFSVCGGKQTMLCGPYRGSLPLLLKAMTPSCLSTSAKLWTIVPRMPALVTSLPR